VSLWLVWSSFNFFPKVLLLFPHSTFRHKWSFTKLVICAREKKYSLKIIKKFPSPLNTYYLEANRKVAGRARHTLKVILPQTGVYPFNACYNLPYYSITEHLYLQPTCDTLLLQVIKILRMYCSATHKSNSSLIQWNEGFLKSKTQLKYSFAFQNTFPTIF